jgi:P27 family predicted phage terminase small subunit
LLRPVDVAVLAAYCQSYGRWLVCEELLAKGELVVKGRAGLPRPNPLLRISRAAANMMVTTAGQFGLTPAARSRIAAGIGGQPEPSKFDGLI